MNYDLTEGNIVSKLLKFAFPIMVGNMLQQLYNVADTLIVGKYLGQDALAAVGSSYTLMVFITSILLGLCMGSGAFFSMQFGSRNYGRLKKGLFLSFLLIGKIALLLTVLAYGCLSQILAFLHVPGEVAPLMKEYLLWIFAGILAVFLYNFAANLLRAIGNSIVPLFFLGISSILNIFLDLLFICCFHWGVGGAAAATVLSQYLAGGGILYYCLRHYPELRLQKEHCRLDLQIFRELAGLSSLTCLQQSVMNFGILMVQGLVNSFGSVVMAAFAAGVKIDSFAYAPVQDFGNAFSTYVAQNYGAGKTERIRKGMKDATLASLLFCLAVSALVFVFARNLMGLFLEEGNQEAVSIGIRYLRLEGTFYFGIGLLFLFYGYFRAIHQPGVSVVLTVISLGTRVALAYGLSAVPALGVNGIWISVPIGWGLADLAGACYYFRGRKKLGRRFPIAD